MSKLTVHLKRGRKTSRGLFCSVYDRETGLYFEREDYRELVKIRSEAESKALPKFKKSKKEVSDAS